MAILGRTFAGPDGPVETVSGTQITINRGYRESMPASSSQYSRETWPAFLFHPDGMVFDSVLPTRGGVGLGFWKESACV
jgi:hypothetical protein